MANSLVSAANINANFPLAGQNNSSQGFRDNFSAIKDGLSRTSVELTELRDRALVKSAVPGAALDNDLNYTALIRPQLKSYSEFFYNNGTVGANFILDFYRGNFQKITTSGNCSLAFTNFPSGNNVGRLCLWIEVVQVTHRINLPVEVSYGTNNQFVSASQLVFPAAGNYLLDFIGVADASRFWIIPLSGFPSTTSGTNSSSTTLDVNSLPYASEITPGVVKIDGTTIAINNQGVIRSVAGVLPSDLRLKDNIEQLVNPLALARLMTGISFRFKDTGLASVGLIAQEVEQVIPELVSENENGYKHVNYSGMAGLFVECIKKLEDRVLELESRLDQLKDR